MSLSEGLLTAIAATTTKYVVTESKGTTNYTVISTAVTDYTVTILQGLFLGKQNAVVSGYVADGYFAGVEIF